MRKELVFGVVFSAVLSGAAVLACSDSSGDTPSGPDSGPSPEAQAPTDAPSGADTSVAPDAAEAGPGDVLTPDERAAVGLLSPLPAVPADTTNAVADNAASAPSSRRS